MQDDEVKEQLASLRAAVQALGDDLHRLRQEDLRTVYSEQIRSVLEERVLQHFSPRRRGKNGCKDPATCAIEVSSFITRSMAAYKESGLEAGKKVLDGLETQLREAKDTECSSCAEFKRSIAAEIRNYLDLSADWRRQLEPGARARKSGTAKQIVPRPEEVEAFLAPVSSTVRVRLMMLLKNEGLSLAELSRRTTLVKGHLQFHLRSLTEAGLVNFDRMTKVYDLSTKGELVLDGILMLMRKAGPDAADD